MPVDPALGAGAQRLAAAVETIGHRPRRAPAVGALCVSQFRAGSWYAQRLIRRSAARRRIAVTGRGVGKTHCCAEETLQVVMDAPPGSMGAVLAPTLTHAEAAIQKLRELARPLGAKDSDWVSTKRTLRLPGERTIKIFSADRKEVVRGPSIVILWIEEGAYLSQTALTSSIPSMRAGLADVQTRLLVSTTPAGGNWVKDYWDKGQSGKLALECFRFRSTESPYQDPEDMEFARQTMSPERYAQEYLAEFVANLLLVFPDREGLFVERLPERKASASWIGVDLGEKDYTVCTLMNEWQEGRVLARWNGDTPGFNAATYWAQTYDQVQALCVEHGAGAVVDTGGAGGAAGAVLAEYLRSSKDKDGKPKASIAVVEIKTSSQGTKAKIVEQAKADVQWKKVRLLHPEHPDSEHARKECGACQLDYEMSKFQGLKRQIHGQEVMIYEGPQVVGEHDDCVISFCLANWGRVHGETVEDHLQGDFSGFMSAGGGTGGGGNSSPGDLGDWAP